MSFASYSSSLQQWLQFICYSISIEQHLLLLTGSCLQLHNPICSTLKNRPFLLDRIFWNFQRNDLAYLNDLNTNQIKWSFLLYDRYSVTRFGEIWPLRQNFEGFFLTIWQNIKPTLTNLLHYWANFPCYQWPNIET